MFFRSDEKKKKDPGIPMKERNKYHSFREYACQAFIETGKCPECEAALEVFRDECRVKEVDGELYLYVHKEHPRFEPGASWLECTCQRQAREAVEEAKRKAAEENKKQMKVQGDGWFLWEDWCCSDWKKGECRNCAEQFHWFKIHNLLKRALITRKWMFRCPEGSGPLDVGGPAWPGGCKERVRAARESLNTRSDELEDQLKAAPEHVQKWRLGI